MMKTPQQIHVETVRDIMLASIIAAFVIGGIVAASIAADRYYADECQRTQEYRPCR